MALCLLVLYMNVLGVHCLRMVNNNNRDEVVDAQQDEPLKVEERHEEMLR